MTPDHQEIIENMLQLAYARSLTWLNSMAIPQGLNPPLYTKGMMWNSPLGQDLQAIANSVESYPVEGVAESLDRVFRVLFGQILDASKLRLPRDFHKTPLGQLLNDAYVRRYPADAWMRTSEVQKLFGVKRQTVYDWAEEGKLTPYHIKGTQMFRRKYVLRFHERWAKQKQQKLQASKKNP